MSTPEGLESQSAVEAAARDSSGSGGHAVEPRHSKPPADESEATLATAQDAGPGNSGLPEHASAAPQKLPPPVGGGSGSSGGSDGDKRAQSKADRSAAADTQPEASGAGGSCSAPPAEAATRGHYSDVIGRVNRYTMPNIASMLPNYANGDAEFIFRTFNTGNYDMLKHLPQTIREQQVAAARGARQEAARTFLMPGLGSPLVSGRAPNGLKQFSTFEYIPSRYSLADELAARARVESEAKRMVVGDGKEFIPSNPVAPLKHTDRQGGTFPTASVGTPYQGGTSSVRNASASQPLEGKASWTTPGTQRLSDGPSRAAAWEMMNNVRAWVAADWEGVDVTVFENDEDCWVVRVALEGVDSVNGLGAYMNVFMRCNDRVNRYKLNKVPEFWGTTPGDGAMYFVIRPPWVRVERVQAYFTMHPEERDWRTSHAVNELAALRPPGKDIDSDPKTASMLGFGSRLEWGTNFYTGTSAGCGHI